MPDVRIALANLREPATREESVSLAVAAVAEAGKAGALVVCFPECFVPGYRWPDVARPAPDAAFLEAAWREVAAAARAARTTVILGTERITERGLQISALVIDPDGTVQGWQDKGQLDPDEEPLYPAYGTERRVFTAGPLTFGVVICHEGWRYPETVRWAVRRGAQVVFHPHVTCTVPGAFQPTTFADPRNTFHEKAILCRAAENTCYIASVNCMIAGSGTTSAIANPDGTLRCHQPYGAAGLLVEELPLEAATRQLAMRCRTSPL